jgi:hypothetical protein
MLRIPFGDLEELKKNPIAYKVRRETEIKQGGGKSYFGVLRNTIFKFHNAKNVLVAVNYLEEHLEGFRNRERCQKVVDDFRWYLGEYQALQWRTIKTQVNIIVPLTTQFLDSFKVSGQICRIDMNPDGGYAAWLFRSRKAEGWMNEFQMPIIQNAAAVRLGISPSRMTIGLYDFELHLVHSKNYSESEIGSAHAELEDLLRKMGY